jgi:hypothetical protein
MRCPLPLIVARNFLFRQQFVTYVLQCFQCIGERVSLRSGLDGCGKSHPHGDSILGPSSLWRVSTPTPLSRPTLSNTNVWKILFPCRSGSAALKYCTVPVNIHNALLPTLEKLLGCCLLHITVVCLNVSHAPRVEIDHMVNVCVPLRMQIAVCIL